MFNIIKLLGKLSKISSATDDIIHSTDEIVKKRAIVTVVMIALELIEAKMKVDLANDEQIRDAAVKLADVIFAVAHSIKDND